MKNDTNIGVVILAAGASKRMGLPKSSLKYDTSRTFISRLVEVYAGLGCKHIVIIVNSENASDVLGFRDILNKPRVNVIINRYQELGRVYSLQLGIKRLMEVTNFCFVQDVDRPGISIETLKLLKGVSREGHWSFLKYNDRKGHPVLISKEIMEYIGSCDAKSTILSEVLSHFPYTEAVTTDPSVLLNINTPVEYEKHFEVIEIETLER